MDSLKPRILICAGGTGGHIIPALTIAKELASRGYEVHWLGTKAGLEANLVPKHGLSISYICIDGLRGKQVTKILLIPFKLVVALLQSMKILLQLKPVLVLGMGGFVTGPSGIAAWLLKIPLIIHEQNAIPGTANKILAKFAKKILTGFPHSFTNSTKVQFTGNPIRAEFAKFLSPEKRFAADTGKLRLLVVGGSRGALALNKCIPQALRICATKNIEVWHQTGQNHLQISLDLYKQLQIAVKVEAFIEDMAHAYSWANLVICRAGAITIAELAAVGIASILIPFPYAIDDHQTKNAEYLSKAKAAILMQERELTPEKLARLLQEFLQDRDKLITMAQAANKLANYQAVDNVVTQCLSLL